MHRNGLRLVHSAEEHMSKRRAQAQRARVYPPSVSCFSCFKRFHGDDVKPIVHNDGACNECAAKLDSYPHGSSRSDDTEHEWQETKC